ncbi:ATP-dependent DNA helicase PIF1 [Medicago truncatula]|uniref:ATP-dependent DNA helicase PIF1 n=1 Tax=Medicago truncatula TaxID=3880 RepID=UPI000D2F181A|nr:ATP-dependent DNA helicase PIF1 [Medicago truncatula]
MNLQATFDDYLPPITSLLAYRHNITNMILLYTGNVPQMLDTLKTTVNIIDDCGNLWVCELNFVTFPYEHFKIGRRWNRFVEARRLREGVKIIGDLRLTHEQLKAYALAELETMLQSFGKSLSDFPPMPKADASLVPDVESRLIHDEMSYNRPVLAAQHDRMMSTMTSEQRNVYDKIMTRVKEDKPGLFFLYGYGGTGKTFIWRALCAALRSDGEIVLACASSGIAALLIPDGRTAHSRFSIPFTIDKCSMCGVTPNTPLASLPIKAKLIIWDEAPMMHKHCFEALDRSLRDVLKTVDKRNKDIPFGGKVVVLGGDFRQILPVMPGSTRPEVVNASINSSHLWRYCEVLTLTKNMRLLSSASESDIEGRKLFSDWVLRVGDGTIGDGTIGEINDVDISVVIPSDLLIPSSGNPIASIVDSTYPNLLGNIGKVEYFQSKAILAPKNAIVEQVNDYVLDLIPGEEKIYLSYDTPYHKNIDGDVVDDIHTPEFLNTFVASGLPNHRLQLKVGASVMLLRNMDQSLGLCNGTRLIITKMGKFVLEGRVISGSNIGEKVFIPRLSLTPSDNRIPFKFKRRQFPISVSFAMTINKSEGQSLEHVGVYLPSPIFSYGQLYVAISQGWFKNID